MRTSLRTAAVAGVAALAAFGLIPTAQAASPRTVLTVGNDSSYEYEKYCLDDAPYTCGTRSGHLAIMIQVTDRPKNTPITVGYQIVNGTATAGQDFTAAPTGTVTIPTTAAQAYVQIPVVNDGIAEPTETFQVRLTSSSVPADISDTGTGTILDGGVIPVDCNMVRTAGSTVSMTCTNRPATQRWRAVLYCIAWGLQDEAYGNIVTGNGTSTADCATPYLIPGFQVVA